mgnify:CR=1 FL=1
MRSGATMVETTIVLGVLLFLILGVLQLGINVLRANVVSDAARRLAREACVHGAMASPNRVEWGPNTVSGTADDASQYSALLTEVIPTINPAAISYELEWLDGDNEPMSRVQVRIEFTESPIISMVDWLVPSSYTATSTSFIAH